MTICMIVLWCDTLLTLRLNIEPDRLACDSISACVSDLSKLKEQIIARCSDQKWRDI